MKYFIFSEFSFLKRLKSYPQQFINVLGHLQLAAGIAYRHRRRSDPYCDKLPPLLFPRNSSCHTDVIGILRIAVSEIMMIHQRIIEQE